MADDEVRVSVTGDDGGFSETLDRAKNKIEDVERSAEKASGGGLAGFGKAAGIAGVAVTGFAAAGGAALLKFGADFDDAFDTIAIGTGASGKALEGLKDDFRGVFGSIPTDMGSAATAVADFNTLTGATGDTLQGLSKNAIEMTRLMGGDLQGNIAVVSQAMNRWGLEADAGAGFMDQLFVASQKTGTGIDVLAGGLEKNGEILSQMGFSVTESIALLGSLDKAGIDSQKMLMGMARATADWAKEGVSAKDGLAQTIAAIQNAKDPVEATALAMETFGNKAGPDMLTAIRSGAITGIDDLVGALEESQGAILETAQSTDDFGQQWTVFKNRAILAIEPLATKVFELANQFTAVAIPALEAFGGVVGPIIEDVTGFIEDLIENGIQLAIDKFGEFQELVISGFELIQEPLNLFEEKFTEVFSTKMDEVLPKVEALKGSFDFGDIKTEGFSLISEGISDIGSALEPVLPLWQSLVSSIGDKLLVAVSDIAAAFSEELGPTMESLGPMIQASLPILETMAQVLGVVLVGAITAVLAILETLVPVIGTVLVGAIQQAGDAIRAIATIMTGTFQIIEGVWNVFKGLFTGDWKLMWEGLGQIFTGAWTIIEGLVTYGLETVKNLFSTAYTALNELTRGNLGELVAFFTALPGQIVGALGDLTGLLVQKGTDILTGLWNGVQEMWETTRTFFGNIGLFTLSAIGDLSSLLWDVGSNLVQGLWDGVQSKWDSFTGWLGDAAGGLKEVVTNPLGIFSPSRVFHELGENVIAGFSEGLEEEWYQELIPKLGDLLDHFLHEADQWAPEAQENFAKYMRFIAEEGLINFREGLGSAGDWGNDWLTHLPKDIRGPAQEIGQAFAETLSEALSGAMRENLGSNSTFAELINAGLLTKEQQAALFEGARLNGVTAAELLATGFESFYGGEGSDELGYLYKPIRDALDTAILRATGEVINTTISPAVAGITHAIVSAVDSSQSTIVDSFTQWVDVLKDNLEDEVSLTDSEVARLFSEIETTVLAAGFPETLRETAIASLLGWREAWNDGLGVSNEEIITLMNQLLSTVKEKGADIAAAAAEVNDKVAAELSNQGNAASSNPDPDPFYKDGPVDQMDILAVKASMGDPAAAAALDAAKAYNALPTQPWTPWTPSASFAVGTSFVPRDMLAWIHRGEAIIPASLNHPGAEERGDVHFHFHAMDAASFREWMNRGGGEEIMAWVNRRRVFA